MTKKEIIKLLDKDIGLFEETEDENNLGELYLTELQFKEIDNIFKQIQGLRESTNNYLNQLRKIVEGNDRFEVWKDTEMQIENKIINVKLPLIILDGKIIFINNIFNDHAK